MTAFEPGDLVRIVGNNESPFHFLEIGSLAEVVGESDLGTGNLRVEGIGVSVGVTVRQYVSPDDVELVRRLKPQAGPLRQGYRTALAVTAIVATILAFVALLQVGGL